MAERHTAIAPPRRLALLLVSVLLVCSLAGCGGGGGDESSQQMATSSKRSEGGNRSIEDFGVEASGDERTELILAFRHYLEALASGDFRTACRYLSSSVQSSLKELARSRSASCTEVLPAVLSPSAASIARAQANGRVTKVRAEGGRAFVVFRAPGASLYQQTMSREGEWKLTTVIPSILIPSAATLGP